MLVYSLDVDQIIPGARNNIYDYFQNCLYLYILWPRIIAIAAHMICLGSAMAWSILLAVPHNNRSKTSVIEYQFSLNYRQMWNIYNIYVHIYDSVIGAHAYFMLDAVDYTIHLELNNVEFKHYTSFKFDNIYTEMHCIICSTDHDAYGLVLLFLFFLWLCLSGYILSIHRYSSKLLHQNWAGTLMFLGQWRFSETYVWTRWCQTTTDSNTSLTGSFYSPS